MQARLPKTKRVPEAFANAQITERSLSIIDVIARYRFVLARDIVRVVGGNEDVTHRHLQQLFHRDLISRFTLPVGANRGEFVYFLDNAAGLRKLCQSSHLNAEHFDWDEINRNRQKYGDNASRSAGHFLFIEHELMISRFHADIEMACRADGNAILDRWIQGSALWNTVQVELGRTVPHRPDALFTLRFASAPEGQQRATFLYEADRGTTSLSRLREKLEAHAAFLEQGRILELYGLRRLRSVLVETLSKERVNQIRSIVAELAKSRKIASALFWLSCTNADHAEHCLWNRRWLSGDERLRCLAD